MKIATWNTISAGQIVKFRYKSEKTDKSYNRTVIVLDPIYRYLKKSTNRRIELLVGIEIDNDANPPLSPIKLKQLFKILGQERDEGEIKSMNETQVLQNIYEDLKRFLVGSPIFKTYLLRKCRKNRVFLEDKYQSLNTLQVKQVAEKISKQKDTINILEQNLED